MPISTLRGTIPRKASQRGNVTDEHDRYNVLPFNVSKCKCMVVSRKRANLVFQYSLNSKDTSQADSYRYLDILINSKLSWPDHILKLVADASTSLYYLKRTLSLSPPELEQPMKRSLGANLNLPPLYGTPTRITLLALLSQSKIVLLGLYQNTINISAFLILNHLLGLQQTDGKQHDAACYTFQLCSSAWHTLLVFMPSRRPFNSKSIRLRGTTLAFNKSFLPNVIEDWKSSRSCRS